MKRTLILIAGIFIVFMSFGGCTSEVPPGYVGMIMTSGGLSGTALQPGRHGCYGRDRMYLIELKEDVKTEPLSILCADDLNFKFDLKIRARLKMKNVKGIMQLLTMKGADMNNVQTNTGAVKVLKFDTLYNTYVQPQARSIARAIVSKYETTQIRENRDKIQGTIQEELLKALKGTPMEVPMITTSNFDYPDVITNAVEKRRKREIEIGEEKAKQAMELLRAENRLKLAQKLKQVRAEEAAAESVYYRIVGSALTNSYLKLRKLENEQKLYGNVGQGDKVIITGNNGKGVMPIVNMK